MADQQSHITKTYAVVLGLTCLDANSPQTNSPNALIADTTTSPATLSALFIPLVLKAIAVLIMLRSLKLRRMGIGCLKAGPLKLGRCCRWP
ncbi:hypothetical protein [Acaryochloris thomasi]|uniref:hypothetical protein n=1 Tax=Acaryochloris thomasi TaxID=2929456 RepID=UPI0011B5F076|nr:hypothetical protein [Acaryochloris thomasi]